MSTRGLIARKTKTGFEGVYHHFDSYPQGLGNELWNTYHGHFQGDLKCMLVAMIDKHPAGWSTILDADWDLAPGFVEYPTDITRCVECGKFQWVHYRQYYKQNGATEPKGSEIMVLGHSFKADMTKDPKNPQCYCHGRRHEEAMKVTEENASGSGCEYAYVFDEATKEMYVLSSYRGNGNGKKMVGWFGCGDEKATWNTLAVVKLDEKKEPDWEKMGDF